MFLRSFVPRADHAPRATILRLHHAAARPTTLSLTTEPTVVMSTGHYLLRVANGNCTRDTWVHTVPNSEIGMPATMHLPRDYGVAFLCEPNIVTRMHVHSNNEVHFSFTK